MHRKAGLGRRVYNVATTGPNIFREGRRRESGKLISAERRGMSLQVRAVIYFLWLKHSSVHFVGIEATTQIVLQYLGLFQRLHRRGGSLDKSGRCVLAVQIEKRWNCDAS
jgi:hypothetical protein